MAGNFYILMHPQGREGSHQKGGPEVWVINPKTKKTFATY